MFSLKGKSDYKDERRTCRGGKETTARYDLYCRVCALPSGGAEFAWNSIAGGVRAVRVQPGIACANCGSSGSMAVIMASAAPMVLHSLDLGTLLFPQQFLALLYH